MNFNGQIPSGGSSSFPASFDFSGDVGVGGTLSIADGTIDAPSLAFTSDEKLGFYKKGDKKISFVSDGTSTMDIEEDFTFIPGQIKSGTQPYISASSESFFTIPTNVSGIIPFDAFEEQVGTAITWNEGDSKFDLNEPGRYHISGFLYCEAPVGGFAGRRTCSILFHRTPYAPKYVCISDIFATS